MDTSWHLPERQASFSLEWNHGTISLLSTVASSFHIGVVAINPVLGMSTENWIISYSTDLSSYSAWPQDSRTVKFGFPNVWISWCAIRVRKNFLRNLITQQILSRLKINYCSGVLGHSIEIKIVKKMTAVSLLVVVEKCLPNWNRSVVLSSSVYRKIL